MFVNEYIFWGKYNSHCLSSYYNDSEAFFFIATSNKIKRF